MGRCHHFDADFAGFWDLGWGGPDGARYGGRESGGQPRGMAGLETAQSGQGQGGQSGCSQCDKRGLPAGAVAGAGLLGRVVIFTVIPACAGIQRRNRLIL